MHIFYILAFCVGALAAPTIPKAPSPSAGVVRVAKLAQYYDLLGKSYGDRRSKVVVPTCNLQNVVMPIASPSPLPPVTPGLMLKHVAIGRGTQNYTCANETATPVANGAVAVLYNATCLAADYPEVLALIPRIVLEFSFAPQKKSPLTPTTLLYSGDHFFSNSSTPVFNLQTPNFDLGVVPCQKDSATPAPANAPKGQFSEGNGAVPWLRLQTRQSRTGNVEEVYRINTAGGNPPASCVGMGETFAVEYATEYWFYGSD